ERDPGLDVHPVEARLVSRHGWVIGIVVCQVSPHAVAWRWWSGTSSEIAFSEADAVACLAAKSGVASSLYPPGRELLVVNVGTAVVIPVPLAAVVVEALSTTYDAADVRIHRAFDEDADVVRHPNSRARSGRAA